MKKKKYAGIVVGSDGKSSLETKGIFRSNWPEIVTKCVRCLLDDIFELDTSSVANGNSHDRDAITGCSPDTDVSKMNQTVSTLSAQNERKNESNRVLRNNVDDTENVQLEEANIAATQSTNRRARGTVLTDSNVSKHKRRRSTEATSTDTKRQKIYHSSIECSSELIKWILSGTEEESETEDWSQALRSRLEDDHDNQTFHTIGSHNMNSNVTQLTRVVEKNVIKGLTRIKRIVDSSIEIAGQDAVELFSIAENLSKNPHVYKNPNTTHVFVALKLNRGGAKRFKAGDIVRYVICGHGEDLNVHERAVHVDDFVGAALKVDTDYYIHRLIVPSIFSLCKPLGLSGEDVEFYLNVKPNKPVVTVQKVGVKNETCETLSESTKNPFRFKCITCNFENAMENLTSGKCSNVHCSTRPLDNASYMKNQLQLYLRDLIKKFHYREMTCDNVVCGNVTKIVTTKIKGRSPLCYKCEEGNLALNYTWWELYNDLNTTSDSFHKAVTDFQTSMHVKDVVTIGSLWRLVDETVATLNEFKVNLSVIFELVTPKERTNNYPIFLNEDIDF